jgi:hypothetical protein
VLLCIQSIGKSEVHKGDINVMKRKLFLSILIVFFTISLMSLLGCNNQNPTKEQSTKNIKEVYELQERCGKQTSEFFKKEYGDGIFRDGTISGYQNHYNKKLNKCFIIITSTSPSMKLKNLFDFNENKELGTFVENKSLPMDCRVFEKSCKSEEEWDSLVKPYMEE